MVSEVMTVASRVMNVASEVMTMASGVMNVASEDMTVASCGYFCCNLRSVLRPKTHSGRLN